MPTVRLNGLALVLSAVACGRADFYVVGTENPDDFTICAAGECQRLGVAATTSRTISWSWDARTLPAGVNGYLLAFHDDREVLRAGNGHAWDVDDDTNLAWHESPYGPQVVQRTTVYDLEPNTTYHALLWARFRDGSSRAVAQGNAATLDEPGGRVVIFEETEHTHPGVWLLDFEDPATADHAHQGDNALWFATTGEWVNARMGEMAVDTTSIPDPAWADAYLELFIEISEREGRAHPVPYLEIRLWTYTDTHELFTYSHPAYATLPNRPGWHRIQAALCEFRNTAAVPFSVAPSHPNVVQFEIGARFDEHRTVWVDDVLIRYGLTPD